MANTYCLPPRATSFIGRSEELAAIVDLLSDPVCRLLTLVGPGGIGKTRLAIEAAKRMADSFNDGVYFVELVSLHSPGEIIPAIAGAVGCQFYQPAEKPADSTVEQSQVQLLDFLRAKHMLLVLDGFEHLLPGSTLVDSILTTAPAVKLLVTSRAALHLTWEWLYDVVGMPFPTDESTTDYGRYSAIQLFQERARQAQPQFSLHDDPLSMIRICQLVEGMPLGIELAASWLRVFSGRDLAARIMQSLAVLTDRGRPESGRHGSLRAVFIHSWVLLGQAEQDALMQMAVFTGSFSLAAAEAVTGASQEVMSALVDQSLLRLDAGGCYSLHEAIRQFSAEKLESDPARHTETLDRHSDYYCALLADCEHDLKGRRSREALDTIAAALGNVRAAWRWAVQQHRVMAARQALSPLYYFYLMRAYLAEGVEVFRRATEVWEAGMSGECGAEEWLVLAGLLVRHYSMRRFAIYEVSEQEPLHRSLNILRPYDDLPGLALALRELGRRLSLAGKAIEGEVNLWESYKLYEALDDSFELSQTLAELGNAAGLRGDREAARCFFQESQIRADAVGSRYAAFRSLEMQGDHAVQAGEYPEAIACYEKGLAYAREVDFRQGILVVLSSLVLVYCYAGDHSRARQCGREAVAVAREIGAPGLLAMALHELGQAAYVAEDLAEAEECLREAVTLIGTGSHFGVSGFCLCGLAQVLGARGDALAANQLYEKALATMRTAGFRRGEAIILDQMAWSAYRTGAYARARELCETSLPLHRVYSRRHEVAVTLSYLGHITEALGNHTASLHCFHEALQACWEMKRTHTVMEIISGLARHRANAGEASHAVELLALALNHPATHIEVRVTAEPLLAQLEAELEPDVFSAAWGRGKSLDLAVVVAEFLEESRAAQPDARPGLPELLSERELEILACVADGLSNREIAQELVIALGTVKSHVYNICQKLGVERRTQAVARARTLKLL